MPRQSQTIQTKQDNKRKFYHQVGGEYTWAIQQSDAKEAKQTWSKQWKQKEPYKKSEFSKSMNSSLLPQAMS